MEVFSCSYCKTGVMNTSEQYLKHVNGTKHKKKAFQHQAPHQGIEYEQFRPKSTSKPVSTYEVQQSDFPSLPGSLTTSKTINTADYKELVETFEKKPNNPEPVIEIIDDEYDDSYQVTSIEDLFNKDDCKPSSALHTIDEFSKHKKTAAQSLNEVAQFMNWELEFEQSAGKSERYGIQIFVCGALMGEGEGENKKIAKQNASASALYDIRRRIKDMLRVDRTVAADPDVVEDKQSKTAASVNMDHPADSYRDLAWKKLKEIEDNNLHRFAVPRRYAAFILTEHPDQIAKDGLVVAFGAGNGVLSQSALENLANEHGFNKLPGYFITNFDSLVLARRSLQCFFYNQLLLFFDTRHGITKRDKNYLELNKNGFVKLKQGCRLHLYLSHAPYGDCRESMPKDYKDPIQLTRKELERDKMGKTDPIMFMSYTNNQYMKQPGHIRILEDEESNSWMSIIDYRKSKRAQGRNYLTMSPSDKLMSWIHLGIQGAFLSHLIEPVFLYSIQFGSEYMHQHISRALLSRVPLESLLKEQTRYYKTVPFKDPFLARISEIVEDKPPSRYLKKEGVCFNWYLNPVSNHPEIIDIKTGCIHQDSPFKLPNGEQALQCSRLSKVCMIVRLKNVFEAATQFYAMKPEFRRNRDIQGINQAAQYNYCKLKNSARDYRQLKEILFSLLNRKRYGDWQPNEQANKFDLTDYYELNTSSSSLCSATNYSSSNNNKQSNARPGYSKKSSQQWDSDEDNSRGNNLHSDDDDDDFHKV